MSVIAIKQNIINALNQMQALKAAYDYEAANLAGEYPYATVRVRQGKGKFLATTYNCVQRGYRIMIYQEQTKVGQGAEQAEAIIGTIIDEMETFFAMNTTLSGACKYVMPIKWRATFVPKDHDVRICEIDVDAVEVILSQK